MLSVSRYLGRYAVTNPSKCMMNYPMVSVRSRYSTGITREDFFAAKKMIKLDKFAVGNGTYDQRSNESMATWPQMGFGPNLIDTLKVNVDVDWYMQGTVKDMEKFARLLGGAPVVPRLRSTDPDKTEWYDGTGRDVYMVVSEVARYKVNTPPSKIITDYIRERIWKDAKDSVTTLPEILQKFEQLNIDVPSFGKKTYTKLKKIMPGHTKKAAKQKANEVIAEVANELYKRGYTTKEELEEVMEKSKEAKEKAQNAYNLVVKLDYKPTKRHNVRLTQYPPPKSTVRDILTFDKDEVYLRDIADRLNERMNKKYVVVDM